MEIYRLVGLERLTKMSFGRVFAFVITVVVVLSFVAACGGGKTENGGDTGAKFLVGVSLLTEEHPFYRELKKAYEEQAKERGIKSKILSCNMDLSTQTTQVENFINLDVDAIVLSPAKSAGIAGAIRKANKAGIPVFTVDIAAEGGDVVSHIASDNVQGGRLAGEFMAKALAGKGKIAILDHPEVISVQDRVKGFREEIAKHAGLKIVDVQAAQGKRDVAVTVTENILQKHGDLDGIFAINDSTALGALAAIGQAGRSDIVLVGYDGDPEARKKILAGTALRADAVQYPDKIGHKAADIVADFLEGKDVPALVPVEVGLIDKKTLEEKALDMTGESE